MKVKTLKRVMAQMQMLKEVSDKLKVRLNGETYHTGNRVTGEVRHICVILRNSLSDLRRGK